MQELASLDFYYKVSIVVLPILLAVTLHEAAHGFVAWRLGDDTAYKLGRVSANPFRHVDPFGTVLLPGLLFLSGSSFLFGYAKPVPVKISNLRHPRRDGILVAAAGPGANLLIAVASAFLLHFAPEHSWLHDTLVASALLNVSLAVFNMLPIPPLDGSRVVLGLLPLPLARIYQYFFRFGLLLVLLLVLLLPMIGRDIGINLDIIGWMVRGPVRYLLGVIATITGHG